MRHLIILLSTLICLLTSCNKNRETVSGQDGAVNIRLQVMETAPDESAGKVSETLVSSLNLFCFDPAGNLIFREYLARPGHETAVSIPSGVRYTIYAIANTADLTDRTETATRYGIENMLWTLGEPGQVIGENGEIPMSGMLATGTIAGGETLSVRLTRLCSKFRLFVDTSALNKDVSVFDITRVCIRNMNRKVRYFRQSGAKLTSDVFDTGISITGRQDLEKLYNDGLDIYIPENVQGNLLKDNTDEQTHVPPSPYDRLCTYVEFTVSYRSPERYSDSLIYRYYLHDGRQLNNFDIVRNTMYTCHTGFSGDGLGENSWRVDVSGMKDMVTGITVEPAEASFFQKGQSRHFYAKVTPASAENNSVTWSSSDENVATVSDNGTVTAVGDGQCTITATATDGSHVSGSATAHVYIDSKLFEIKDFPDTLYPGYNSPVSILYDIYPEASPVFTLQTVSGDSRGAELNRNTVTAYNPVGKQGFIGTYTLRAYANQLTRMHTFNVDAGEIRIDRINTNAYLGINSTLGLETLAPTDATVRWSTDDPSMVTVSQEGSITPHKTGRCKVYAESVTGAKDSVTLTVYEPYLTFIDVTMYEGAIWELVSSIRPIPADLPIEFSVIRGSEYVSISGNRMTGLKRTDGFEDVEIEARLADYPHVYSRARVHVLPAVRASLSGDNRVVNTYGHSSDGSSWNSFRNSLQLEFSHAPNVSMRWEVRDSYGALTSSITVSENGIVNPYSEDANGTYTIIGWDHAHRFRTDAITIEVYQLLEYETGLGSYSVAQTGSTGHYIVTLTARWSEDTWSILNGLEQNLLMQQNLVTYPSGSATYHGIGPHGRAAAYISDYNTGIARGTQGITSALTPLRPYSYLRKSFNSGSGNVPGINGVYYKFTPAVNKGLEGYFFIKQKNETFFNSRDYIGQN
ncbi:MAG TPA: Ig-like domain-containing protein [Candidatus Coprenecus pullistercoris]|nr:Ig-like domain-containing protein [Candidatus Coprenecus pullistercoris]